MVRARFKAGGPGEVGTTELGARLPLLSSTRPAGTGSQLSRYEAYQPMIRSLLRVMLTKVLTPVSGVSVVVWRA